MSNKFDKLDYVIGVIMCAFIIFLTYGIPIALEIEDRGYQERMAKYDWQMEVQNADRN